MKDRAPIMLVMPARLKPEPAQQKINALKIEAMNV
jgi:hypothetical protein